MNKTWLVFKNELLNTIRRKSFILTLILIPLGSFIVLGIISLLQNSEAGAQVGQVFGGSQGVQVHGLVDQSGLIREIPEGSPGQIELYPSEQAARQALDEGAIDAFVLIAEDYLENGTVYYYRPDFNPMEGFDLSAELEHIINTNLLGENQALLARVQNPLNMEMEVLNPEPQRDPGNMLTFFLPYAVTFLFYIVILSSASLMLSSITSEKQNRVIEILMTSITPMQMLTGKIIALGLAGLFQTIVWTTAGLLLLRVSGTTFSLPAEFQLPVSIIFWGAIFFLLGYAVYASLMAGAGALGPNLRESSQVTTILVIPMVIPLMMINPLIQQPNGTIAVVLSLFPLTAPVSMMTRLAGTQVPIWQILLSILLLAITAALVIRAVSGMFRAQNLLSGQPFRMNVFFKALLGRL